LSDGYKSYARRRVNISKCSGPVRLLDIVGIEDNEIHHTVTGILQKICKNGFPRLLL
jgi:hypothetical protein